MTRTRPGSRDVTKTPVSEPASASVSVSRLAQWIEFARISLPRLSTIGGIASDAGGYLAVYVLELIRKLKPYTQRAEISIEYWSGEAVTIRTDSHLADDDICTLTHSIRQVLASGGESIVQLDGARLRLRLLKKPDMARRAAATIAERVKQYSAKPVSESHLDEIKSQISSKLRALPHEFPVRRAVMRELHEVARELIAREFEACLNEEARSLPQSTYEEKKALAKWVNAELRELGLALRCPKTRRPAILRGNTVGHSDAGRFHLEITDERGIRRRTVNSSTLPSLELCPDDLARAPYGERESRGR
jgi:hypothetical protein